MSDENDPVPPPRPTSKTSAVPLKKETVRITLKSEAPAPAVPPPTVPLRAAPPAPAPTISLTPPPRPSVGGAPPPPAAGVPRPGAPVPPPGPVGSKTIPLSQTPPRPATPITRPVTRPGAPGEAGAPTQAMPRATVKLAPAASPGSPVVSAPLRTVHQDDDEVEINEGPLNILAWLSLAAGIVAVILAVATMDKGPFAAGSPATTAEEQAWARGGASEGFKLPMDFSPFDRKQGAAVISKYETVEPVIVAAPTLE